MKRHGHGPGTRDRWEKYARYSSAEMRRVGRVERSRVAGGIAPRERMVMLEGTRYLQSHIVSNDFDDLQTAQYSSRYVPSRTLVLGSGCCRRDEIRSAVFLLLCCPAKQPLEIAVDRNPRLHGLVLSLLVTQNIW